MAKRNLRGVVMFIIACFTSPCCTPLIVPLILALLAGSPIALWLTQNLGWVYGGLTVISIISFVLALRWWGKRNAPQRPSIRPSDIPIIESKIGDKAHVK